MAGLPVRPDWHRYMIVIAAAQGYTRHRDPGAAVPAARRASRSSASRAFRSACSTCCRCGSSCASARSRCCCSACSARRCSPLGVLAGVGALRLARSRRVRACAPCGRSSRRASSSAACSSPPGCSASRSPAARGAARAAARARRVARGALRAARRRARLTRIVGERPLRVLFVTHSFPRWPGISPARSCCASRSRSATQDVDGARARARCAPGSRRPRRSTAIPVERFRYAPRAWETLAYTGAMAEQARGSWPRAPRLAGLLAARRASRRGARLAAWRPDVVHAHWWFPGGARRRRYRPCGVDGRSS